ncbi:alpha-isopropylmalate synthase regulatory domain-containing protein [Sphaerisporangium album]|uniref:alpha-isopropylmalate synthase regulatory domain-containing protein n=1 Tax=Sphaerisporangium album TaxID=509200 RepID=UPI0015F088D5|nr:alpha-isopropylmalate synthase regulatory domain-containing protein [Sphaerisporangium album]
MKDLDEAPAPRISGGPGEPGTAVDDALSAHIGALSDRGVKVRVLDRAEHPVEGEDGPHTAVYVECEIGGTILWGVGIDSNSTVALFKGVASALNRAYRT